MRRHRSREEGQALVEFIIVLPVLLLIVLGIIQFGNVFRDYIALTDAVRVGARQASVSRTLQNPEQVVIARVEKAAVNLDKSKMVISVEPWDPATQTPTWAVSGDVTVRAEYPFKVNLLGLVVFDGKLHSRTTERVE
jgi:Flp pilus assembly protein TadG